MHDRLEDLLAFLKRQRGFDFTAYKPASLTRRIRHRMRMVSSGSEDPSTAASPPQIETYGEYVDHLLAHPEEFNKLFNAILINVTGFFRDHKSWDVLRRDVIPRIVEGLGSVEAEPVGADAPIRVWSAACARGEEAYSLAMAFAHVMGVDAFAKRVKIYASDINERHLVKARAGIYTSEELGGIPEDFFNKFFRPVSGEASDTPTSESAWSETELDAEDEELPPFAVPPGTYVFDPEVRRCLVFGRHDLLSDVPISRVDLLTCRNALMYFNSEAQSRVLARLHFALVPGGYLFLGRAETLLHTAHLFTPIDLRRRIFFKSATPAAFVAASRPPPAAEAGSRPAPVVRGKARADVATQPATAPQLVVGRSGELILANEPARRLFRISAQDLARPISELPLAVPADLRSRIDQVLATGRAAPAGELTWTTPDHGRAFDVQLLPVKDGGAAPAAVTVTYTEVPRISKLREDLQHAAEDRETVHEELQAANDELQSTRDELESTNRALQATNERLETLNAELQSANQELWLTNNQLRVQVEAGARSAEFWNSVMASLHTAVAVIDREMTVLLWNARCEILWGLRGDEAVGKHFLSLDFGLPTSELRRQLRACVNDPGASINQVVNATNREGQPIRCRISCAPLLGAAKVSHGAIILMEEDASEGR
jgi:two-component system CheB/CheR fusion protein